MSNRLANENSPYLLQHAENPVDWFPWSDEAFNKARTEDKPVFLSIGYAACHWCHVMAHESFENPQVAEKMNRSFVNIKVDREERPDVDSIYMSAVVAMTGQGGWPMSVFLTPDGMPFFGGTYYPDKPRYGMPSFSQVIEAIGQAWKSDRERLLDASHELLGQIQKSNELDTSREKPDQGLDKNLLEEASLRLGQSYDWKNGGWGKAPKFPQPMAIEFLLRRATRGDKFALQMAENALLSMSRGGMYDIVGGGFARYSTDNDWLVPHFEKMLYDNAQLSRAYLHAYLLTDNDHYLQVCTATLDFMLRELRDSESNVGSDKGTTGSGGFLSSLDADSEGEEGKFYVWTEPEIEEILSPDDITLFKEAFGIQPGGNFEGKIVLQRALLNSALAEKLNIPEDEVRQQIRTMLQKLFVARSQRIRPGTDDKILTSWNALALISIAEAARYLKRPDYLLAAQKNAAFLIEELIVEGKLLRSWRQGNARHTAFLEDYAALITGLLSLYQSDPDVVWYQTAERLAEQMIAHYKNPDGGFYDTSDEQTDLIIRPKDIQDNATPSGNALAALALLQLSTYSGNDVYRQKAEQMIQKVLPFAARYPTAFAQWLNAADFALADVKEVAVTGSPTSPAMQSLLEELWRTYRPDMIAAVTGSFPTDGDPELLQLKSMINDQPTAYVCRKFVCLQPVTNPKDLANQLNPSQIA